MRRLAHQLLSRLLVLFVRIVDIIHFFPAFGFLLPSWEAQGKFPV